LEGIAGYKSRLYRMKVTVVGQTFDSSDFFALDPDGQRQAGHHPFPVNQNGACPTCAMIAALFRAGESDALAQGVQKRDSWVPLNDMNATIHFQLDVILRRRNRSAIRQFSSGASGRGQTDAKSPRQGG
jgi:hypothetical protein